MPTRMSKRSAAEGSSNLSFQQISIGSDPGIEKAMYQSLRAMRGDGAVHVGMKTRILPLNQNVTTPHLEKIPNSFLFYFSFSLSNS
jgi:hypothetical protein